MSEEHRERSGGRRDDKDKKKGFGKKPYGGKRSDGPKGSGRPSGNRPPRSGRPSGSRDSRSGRPSGRRDSRSGGHDRRNSSFSRAPRRESRREERPETHESPKKLLLPQDASRLLYRGIDCQVNGNNELAMVMFLHGSVMMSEGCENNADRILAGVGKGGYAAMRAEIAYQCSEDALTEFDFLCIRRSRSYDRTYFDGQYAKGSTHAIYRKICLEEVEGNDPVIDEFALRYKDDGDKVVKGLEMLKRKKDSESAEIYLARIEDSVRLKQSVNVRFTRAMNGDAVAVRELKELSKKVPEAAFYSEFLTARAEGNAEGWLRSKYDQYQDLIVARQGEFKIQDTPFGMFLKAKNLERKKEEWMSVMMNAAKAGSPEAIDELGTKMFRNDVRKCLAGIYLKDNDVPNLINVYQAGLDDMYYLDQYCGTDQDRILEVARELGRTSVAKEIDWLKDHYDKGLTFCRDALIERSSDEFYHTKKMIYALHDVGADMEAAKLYFAMEGSPEIPSVKWLKKVCADEDVKEFVRAHYEERGETAVFDSIFEDDGYESRPRRQSKGRGRFDKPRRRY